MYWQPPIAIRTDTLFPYPALCRSDGRGIASDGAGVDGVALVQRRWRAVAAIPARARGVPARVPDAVPGLRAARGAAEPEGRRRIRVHRPGRGRPAHGVRTPPGAWSRRPAGIGRAHV